MRSLRSRLFLAILGAVLVAVGVSLAIGILLTRDATNDAVAANLEREADQLAGEFESLPGDRRGDLLFEAPALPPGIEPVGPPDGGPEAVPVPPPPGRVPPGALPPVMA